MRRSLHGVLRAKRPGRDFGYFLTQRGMFSYTGLTAAQVDRLREESASTSCARGASAWPASTPAMSSARPRRWRGAERLTPRSGRLRQQQGRLLQKR